VDELSVMAPVVALMVRPAVEVNVPAVAPMASVTVGFVVPLTQNVEVGPKLKPAVCGAVMVTLWVLLLGQAPPTL
jgi:hypothetical protein